MLTEAELHRLEATLLPALERHHLRLLAHGLRTLQAIAGRRHGDGPDREAIAAWAARQPQIAADRAFRDALVEQLLGVVAQIGAIGRRSGREPLAVELDDLISWSRARADERIGAE
jgi:hypothetical protein